MDMHSREEEVYDREEVLGRDTASVFPTETKTQVLDADKAKELVGGALKFVSEKELEEIKSSRGLSVEDGTAERTKTLAQVLAENKQKKEDAFQEQWQKMKQGKNRPLDEEEAVFFDTLLRQQAETERLARRQEADEMEAFREALRQQGTAGTGDTPAGPQTLVAPKETAENKAPQQPVAKAVVKPRIRVKPKVGPVQHGEGAAATSAKRQKLAEPEGGSDSGAQAAGVGEGEQEGSGGLAGLLGAYGSDEDD